MDLKDDTHYMDLKDDKNFSSWNCGFAAMSFMYHTNLFYYMKSIFQQNQIILPFSRDSNFHVCCPGITLEDRKRAVVYQHKSCQDELKSHANRSTAAQSSGDALLLCITTAHFPGNEPGILHACVPHWKEQIAQFEKLEPA
jgi:hypothetical protein